MRTRLSFVVTCSLLSALVFGAGCTTTREARKTTPPVPATERVSTQGETEQPRPVAELLKEAEEAFKVANAAQESKDYEAALRHYKRMLELLVQADLDPAIFYNLRSEFEHILKGSARQKTLFDHGRGRELALRGGHTMPMTGEIAFPDSLAELVQDEIREIQENYPRNFQYGLNRSAKYVPYVQQELQKAGLPPDLVWLAQVESQFTPKVVSPAGAAGMWQFMRGTATRYNLRVDEYVDERYDWQKSTHAAIAYLSDLYQMFDGEWPLAVSAYNMGEYGMQRAVAYAGGETELARLFQDPASASRFKQETRKYYPKFLASVLVAKNPESYGFSIEPQPVDEIVRVPVEGSYSLAALDSACGLPEGTLHRLNPELVRGVTPPDGGHLVAVPVGANEQFVAALQDVPKVARGSLFASVKGNTDRRSRTSGGNTVHVVRRGETLSGISERYGVSVKELAAANRIRTSHHLNSGKRLTIPSTQTAKAAPDDPAGTPLLAPKKATAEEPAKAKSAPAPRTYRVKSGDTLYDIAKREGVSVRDLEEWNGLDGPTKIRVGEALVLVPPSSKGDTGKQDRSAEPEKIYHVAKAGDYPARIADRYGVDVNDFLKWNNLSSKSTISVDKKYVVYAPNAAAQSAGTVAKSAKSVEPAPAKEPVVTMHTAAKGESAGAIAAKYKVALSDFIAWNKLDKKAVITAGKKYEIRQPEAAAKSETKVVAKTESTPDKKATVNSETKGAVDTKAAQSKKTVHTVAKGQNPSSIARQYGVKLSDLFKWNGWKSDPVLNVGAQVVILK